MLATSHKIALNQVNYKPKFNYTWCSTKILALYSLYSLFTLSLPPAVSHLLSLQLLRHVYMHMENIITMGFWDGTLLLLMRCGVRTMLEYIEKGLFRGQFTQYLA